MDGTIVLLTPTGARPDQFAICARWMKAQDYNGKVLWVIVDDALPRSTDIVGEKFRQGWTIKKVYPEPSWQVGQNTQGRNMVAGLKEIRWSIKEEDCEAVFIIEDDDYYTPKYLSSMLELRDGADIWGERDTIYYNVRSRGYLLNRNKEWSSLFQTAFTYRSIDNVIALCYEKFIDLAIFGALSYSRNPHRIKNKKILPYKKPLAVGIKGMPGRRGIGSGHTASTWMEPDKMMAKLKELIKDDYEVYRRFADYGNI